MGFNFFKRLFQKEQPEPEKINFSDIENWVKKREEKNREREREISKSIKTETSIFLENINEKIQILKNVDVNQKKGDDKFKSISEEGRKAYLKELEILIEEIKNLEEKNFEKMSQKIKKIFSDFHKKSYKNYERATVLIGKEIGDINDDIRNLSKKITEIFNNKDLENYKTNSFIKTKLNELKEIENKIKEIRENIANTNKTIEKEIEKEKSISKKIEETKKSPEYLEKMKQNQASKEIEQNIEREIRNLRSLINFKELANFYHIFEDKMKIVKDYDSNFKETFEKDFGATLLNLLEESKKDTGIISEKIQKIIEQKKSVKKEEDEVKLLTSQKNKIEKEIEEIKNQNSKKERRLEETRNLKEKTIDEISNKLKEINLELLR